MDYHIEKADLSQAEEILSLYHSLLGRDGCTWNEDYPNMEDIHHDITHDALYLLSDQKRIIACASANRADAAEMLGYAGTKYKNPCILSRLAVSPPDQNKGIAKYLLSYIEQDIKHKGYDGICLLVSKTNSHAIAVYDHMNYRCFGECGMYDQDWYCYEKKLG